MKIIEQNDWHYPNQNNFIEPKQNENYIDIYNDFTRSYRNELIRQMALPPRSIEPPTFSSVNLTTTITNPTPIRRAGIDPSEGMRRRERTRRNVEQSMETFLVEKVNNNYKRPTKENNNNMIMGFLFIFIIAICSLIGMVMAII